MKDWYAVRGLCRWYFTDSGATDRMEERLVLFQAESLDEALDLAEVARPIAHQTRGPTLQSSPQVGGMR